MNPNTRFLLQKGVENLSEGLFASAKLFFIQAIKVDPKNSEANRLLGICYCFLGDKTLAMQCFDKAINLSPRDSNAYNNKAMLEFESGLHKDAILNFNKAINFDRKNYEAIYNLGNALKKLQEYDEAIDCYRRAIAINQNYVEAHNNLANTLKKIDKLDDALLHYEKIVQLQPNDSNSYRKLGNLFYEMGNKNKSKELFLKAIKVNPNDAESHLLFACTLLEEFNLESGWTEYEWRKKTLDHLETKFITKMPEWNGDIDCSKLLVVGEQGLGDQILHSSILKDLEDSKLQITVALNKKLISIYQRSFPKFNFIDISESISESRYDSYIEIGSLGKFFRNFLENFSCSNKFLYANQEKVNFIAKKLPDNKVYCGLAWKSSNQKISKDKSINLDLLIDNLSCLKINFINLQYDSTESEIKKIKSSNDICLDSLDEIDTFNDIESVAALINRCNFVITSSNSIAHLSGALGKKTFLLLPYSTGKFWYWHSINGSSIWYPSIKIFQQQIRGDWTGPIFELINYLEQNLNAKQS